MTGNVSERKEQPSYQGKQLLPIKAKPYGMRKQPATGAEKAIIYKGLDALAALQLWTHQDLLVKPEDNNPHRQAAYQYFSGIVQTQKPTLKQLSDLTAGKNEGKPFLYEQSAYAGVVHLKTIMPSIEHTKILLEQYPWIRRLDATTLVADQLSPAEVKQYLEKNSDLTTYDQIIEMLGNIKSEKENLDPVISKFIDLIRDSTLLTDKEPAFRALVSLKGKRSYLNSQHTTWREDFYFKSMRQNIIAQLLEAKIVKESQLHDARDLSAFLGQILKLADESISSPNATSEQMRTIRTLLLVLYAHPSAAREIDKLLQAPQNPNTIFSPYLYSHLKGSFDNALQTLSENADKDVVRIRIGQSRETLTEVEAGRRVIIKLFEKGSFPPNDVANITTADTKENLIKAIVKLADDYASANSQATASQLEVIKNVLVKLSHDHVASPIMETELKSTTINYHDPIYASLYGLFDGGIQYALRAIDRQIANRQLGAYELIIAPLLAKGLFPANWISSITEQRTKETFIQAVLKLANNYIYKQASQATTLQLQAIKDVLTKLNATPETSSIIEAVNTIFVSQCDQNGSQNSSCETLLINGVQGALQAIDTQINAKNQK